MSDFNGARARVGGATGMAGGGVTTGEVDTAITAALTALTIPADLNDLDDVSGTPATGDLLQYDGTGWVPYTPEAITVTSALAFIIDGGGATITTGIKGDLPPMPFACNITGVALLSDQSGSITVDVWRETLASFPPTAADFVYSIVLSAATRTPTSGSYTTIVDIPVAVGEVLRFNVTGTVTSCQRVTVGLRIEREVGP